MLLLLCTRLNYIIFVYTTVAAAAATTTTITIITRQYTICVTLLRQHGDWCVAFIQLTLCEHKFLRWQCHNGVTDHQITSLYVL